MQYALLIYVRPGAQEALAPAEQEAVHREYLALKEATGIVGGAALHPVQTATTVRRHDDTTGAGGISSRTRLFPLSATYTLPRLSTAMARGKSNAAFRAGPPSPE